MARPYQQLIQLYKYTAAVLLISSAVYLIGVVIVHQHYQYVQVFLQYPIVTVSTYSIIIFLLFMGIKCWRLPLAQVNTKIWTGLIFILTIGLTLGNLQNALINYLGNTTQLHNIVGAHQPQPSRYYMLHNYSFNTANALTRYYRHTTGKRRKYLVLENYTALPLLHTTDTTNNYTNANFWLVVPTSVKTKNNRQAATLQQANNQLQQLATYTLQHLDTGTITYFYNQTNNPDYYQLYTDIAQYQQNPNNQIILLTAQYKSFAARCNNNLFWGILFLVAGFTLFYLITYYAEFNFKYPKNYANFST
jgi:hypothetical protein